MMQSSWHLLLVIGHIAVATGFLSATRGRSWVAPPLTMSGGILLAVASLYASQIEVPTDQGIETVSEPFIGIYALGLGLVGFLLGILLTLRWLTESSSRSRGVSNVR